MPLACGLSECHSCNTSTTLASTGMANKPEGPRGTTLALITAASQLPPMVCRLGQVWAADRRRTSCSFDLPDEVVSQPLP
jgi:hypothetical protein